MAEPAPWDADDDDEAGLAVVIEAPAWQAADLEALAARGVAATLAFLGADGGVVVLGCDDARIAALNADFRGKAQATNVLSFPALDALPRADGAAPVPPGPGPWGDVALAHGVCAAEAAAQGKPLADHATHLIVHAVLHLAGYDHDTDADAATMEAAERSILAGLGIADPYALPGPGPEATDEGPDEP